ncbi:DEAD/DEAH box helicase [Streptomyces sp. TR02-1]|uniref:DEAD/DEAH box helicase n=1 Tax=Streptomyces sp. TR02-1 TaxID=3385977 RepID=UPI0039A2BF59
MNRTKHHTSRRSARERAGGASPSPSRHRAHGRDDADTGGPASSAAPSPAEPEVADFAELGLPEGLLDVLRQNELTRPFPIQAATIPHALAGRDVLGRGRTGSGKTLAFGLALLARTVGLRAGSGRPLALVLVPTRELAQQVTEVLTPYAHRTGLRLATVVGGTSVRRQTERLRRGADVVVATPGRLRDLVERGECGLGEVRVTVLDEADQMADMGFLPQVTTLLDRVPRDGQRLLFSATLDRDVDVLVRRFLRDPAVHSVDPAASPSGTGLAHHVLHVREDDKNAVALHIAAREGRVLMFMDTKRAVDRTVKRLLAGGVQAGGLHGGKSQGQRNRTLEGFRAGRIGALVATNVAARGIHVDDLDLVVNIDPPNDHKDYLHRGGRTGRAGRTGSVVTLVLPHQRRDMTRLLRTARITAPVVRVGPGDVELARVTGARSPSGVPVQAAAPAPPSPEGSHAAPRGKRSGRRRSGARRRRLPGTAQTQVRRNDTNAEGPRARSPRALRDGQSGRGRGGRS